MRAMDGLRDKIIEVLSAPRAREEKAVIVQDVSQDSRYLTTFSATRGEAIVPVLSLDGQRVLGTIDVESDRVHAFRPEHLALLHECVLLLRPLWR
jgi:putative methionine-R-sulfoxide reductase with GAF domain